MLLVADVVQGKQLSMSEAQKKLFGIDELNVLGPEIPAVTHLDYSARIQTVHNEPNPGCQRLASQFKQLTGCPVLWPTSHSIYAVNRSSALQRMPFAALLARNSIY